ncbi:MAG: AAA family ATPase [Erythrobacter sp.]|nr:AAA family ATPase [Erythrobacter sp.]
MQILTGEYYIDEFVKLKAGGLYVLCARPSVGKTALALQLAWTLIGAGERAAIFIGEMTALDVRQRFFQHWGVPECMYNDPTAYKWHDVAEGWRGMQDRLYIRHGAVSAQDIVRDVEVLAAQKDPVRIVVVDYIQYLKAARGEDMLTKVTNAAQALKAVAIDTGCAVIALSQMNRKFLETGKFSLGCIAGGDTIGNEADQVWFLDRPHITGTQELNKGWQIGCNNVDATPENFGWICEKNRRGPRFGLTGPFIGEQLKFEITKGGLR